MMMPVVLIMIILITSPNDINREPMLITVVLIMILILMIIITMIITVNP